jgi:hypothetical protein
MKENTGVLVQVQPTSAKNDIVKTITFFVKHNFPICIYSFFPHHYNSAVITLLLGQCTHYICVLF